MSNKVMYILFNEDIKIGKGKAMAQTAHASCTYIYRNFIKDCEDNTVNITSEMQSFLDDYMDGQKKIVLKCPEWKLEELEKEEKYIVIRDNGLTELKPNTLTCICIGIYDRELDEVPKWIKELKLYGK